MTAWVGEEMENLTGAVRLRMVEKRDGRNGTYRKRPRKTKLREEERRRL